jgi:hypothetical protein
VVHILSVMPQNVNLITNFSLAATLFYLFVKNFLNMCEDCKEIVHVRQLRSKLEGQ